MDSPSPAGSVTIWLGKLKAGDPAAAEQLWQGYFTRLVALARRQLRAAPRAAKDEEDVALSAFDSFFRAVEHGRFPRLNDRDDLWQVLFVVTARKAGAAARHEHRAKRGGGKVVNASVVEGESDAGVLAGVAGGEPGPAFAAEVAGTCEWLLGLLGRQDLRDVAVWKMEGFTNDEIARKIDKSIATVERKLSAIRTIWEREGVR